jgi:MFS family permease
MRRRVRLLGGWLIDRFGRKKIMVASILLYSFSPVGAAFSTSLTMFIIFRCTTFIGVCVEMVAAVTYRGTVQEKRRANDHWLTPRPRRSRHFVGSVQLHVAEGRPASCRAAFCSVPEGHN